MQDYFLARILSQRWAENFELFNDGFDGNDYAFFRLIDGLHESRSVQFSTVQSNTNFSANDLNIFFDVPLNPSIMNSEFRKSVFSEVNYLVIIEPQAISTENWFFDAHKFFNRVFTWDPNFKQGEKYIKVFPFARNLERRRLDLDESIERKMRCVFLCSNKTTWFTNSNYSLRKRVVKLACKEGQEIIDLYGYGWDRMPTPIDVLNSRNLLARGLLKFYLRLHRKPPKIYKGKVNDKSKVLQRYELSLCIDNSSMPGFACEKILDSMLNGAVPIYYGAQDIEKYYPEDTFFNVNFCENATQILDFIRAIPIDAVGSKRTAIHRFLASQDFEKQNEEGFSSPIISEINSMFAHNLESKAKSIQTSSIGSEV